MTRLEYLTKDARQLADFFELMQSDGLQAKGCSLDLLLPGGEATWEKWLETDDPSEDEYDIAAQIAEMWHMVDKAVETSRPAQYGCNFSVFRVQLLCACERNKVLPQLWGGYAQKMKPRLRRRMPMADEYAEKVLYFCDHKKNVNCKKTICVYEGNASTGCACFCTTNPAFASRDQSGNPIGLKNTETAQKDGY